MREPMPDFKGISECIPSSISQVESIRGIKSAGIRFESELEIILEGNKSLFSLYLYFTFPIQAVFTGIFFPKKCQLCFVK